jgi:hypothetical protein
MGSTARSSDRFTAPSNITESRPALPMPTFAEKQVYVVPPKEADSTGGSFAGPPTSSSPVAPPTLFDTGTAPSAPAAPAATIEIEKKDQEKSMPAPAEKPVRENADKPVLGNNEYPVQVDKNKPAEEGKDKSAGGEKDKMAAANLSPATPESPKGNPSDVSNPAASAVDAPKPELSVSSASGGEPILSVMFPWKQYAQPSLQVVIVTDSKVDPTKLQPMTIDGPAALALWKTMVEALNKPLHAGTTEVLKTRTDFMNYEGGKKTLCVRARMNSLEQPSAFGIDKDGLATVFYLLDSWTDKNGDLRISQADLTNAAQFAEKGQLRVWFLDAEKVQWAVTVDWPGKVAPKPVAEQPAPASLPGNAEKPPESLSGPTVVGSTEPLAKPFQPPAMFEQKPALPVPDQKPAVVEQKPVDNSSTFGPGWRPAPKSSESPAWPNTTPAPAARPPVESQPPRETPAKTDLKDMSIDELTQYIEKTWGKTMNPRVRKQWNGGLVNYYHVDNPDSVRRDVFLQLIKLCYNDQDSGDLRNAFAVLYQKLKEHRVPQ